MSTKIRLKRNGRKKKPVYRVMVISSKDRRDGRSIEDLGWFNPFTDECVLKIDRYEHWLALGAIPSDRVSSLVKKQYSGNDK